MNLPLITSFFMWCTIFSGGLLIVSILGCVGAPNLVYRVQNFWLPVPRPAYDVAIYAFLALLKIYFLVFNLIPWLALVMIG